MIRQEFVYDVATHLMRLGDMSREDADILIEENEEKVNEHYELGTYPIRTAEVLLDE